MEKLQPKYKRVLLKLSGEALARDSEGIYNHDFIDEVAKVVKKCLDSGVEIGVVVGAGNIWRGRQGVNMDRVRADHMGMLATVINSLALQDAFERAGASTRVMTAIEMNAMAEPYIRNRAVRHLEKGDMPLSDSLKLFEEGTSLLASCNKMLEDAEQKVVKLRKGSDRAPVETPFEEE